MSLYKRYEECSQVDFHTCEIYRKSSEKKDIKGSPRMQWEDELLDKGGWNSLYKPLHLTSLGIIIKIIVIRLKIMCGLTYVLSYSTIVLIVGAVFAASVLVMRIVRSLYYQIIVSSYEHHKR
jgi:hypothetical protein